MPTSSPHALRFVDRALRDLRAGVPVLIIEGPNALLCLGAEFDAPEARTAIEEDISLLLTEERAASLGLPRAAIRLDASSMDADTVNRWINPLAEAPSLMNLEQFTLSAHPLDKVALQFAKIAELLPALLVSTFGFSTQKDAETWASENTFLSVSAEDIRSYSISTSTALEEVSEAEITLEHGRKVRVKSFRSKHGGPEHLAIIAGQPENSLEAIPVRLHSSCLTGDILGSLRCDCREQLQKAIDAVCESGTGVVLYLSQEGRGIGIANKLRAYRLQDQGRDTMDANEMLGYATDERQFLAAAHMLKKLGISTIRLMTNNPEKIKQIQSLGITVEERLPHRIDPNGINDFYLETKHRKGGHLK